MKLNEEVGSAVTEAALSSPTPGELELIKPNPDNDTLVFSAPSVSSLPPPMNENPVLGEASSTFSSAGVLLLLMNEKPVEGGADSPTGSSTTGSSTASSLAGVTSLLSDDFFKNENITYEMRNRIRGRV